MLGEKASRVANVLPECPHNCRRGRTSVRPAFSQ
jgi:hypothetical protein